MTTICHKKGNTIMWTVTHTDGADNPIDLTGYNIKCQAKKHGYSSTKLFDLSIGNGITVTDVVNGLYEIKIQDTTAYELGKYQIDIQYTDSQGTIQSTETFVLEIEQDITK